MVSIAYAAEYTLKNLVQSVITVVLNPFVIFLSALAILLFLWGLFQFMMNVSNEEARAVGKRHMISGIIGLFIMISAYGIMYFLTNTFGFKKPDLKDLNSDENPYQFKDAYKKN